MRGVGGGREINLSKGSLPYASDISMSYDPDRGVYIGEITSRGGKYRVEGPDTASINRQMDDILQHEYQEMVREVTIQRQREFGEIGRAIMINGVSANMTRYTESGQKVMTVSSSDVADRRESGLAGAMDLGELAMAAFSALHGNWMEVLKSALSMALESYASKIGGGKEETLFAVSFGGILITAKTRAELKKKLILQMNRRIQLIMNHIREHEKKREEAARLGNELVKRIIDKRNKARSLSPGAPQGQETNWRARVMGLREGVGEKRVRAERLWVERQL